jgi:hypothetical protein
VLFHQPNQRDEDGEAEGAVNSVHSDVVKSRGSKGFMRRLFEFIAVQVHNNQEDSEGHPEDLDLDQPELIPEESGSILSNRFFVDFQT